MIYLAILLILTGMLVVTIAFFVEIRKEFGAVIAETKGNNLGLPFNGESCSNQGNASGISSESGIDSSSSASYNENQNLDCRGVINLDDDLNCSDSGSRQDYSNQSDRKSGSEDRDSMSNFLDISSGGKVFSVLYDDKSNIIDYNSGGGMIDVSLSGYNMIKRIGRGVLEFDSDGINFYLDENLYRFDFHSIYDFWSGSNFIALPLRGSNSVKLFLIDGVTAFPSKAKDCYLEYMKG